MHLLPRILLNLVTPCTRRTSFSCLFYAFTHHSPCYLLVPFAYRSRYQRLTCARCSVASEASRRPICLPSSAVLSSISSSLWLVLTSGSLSLRVICSWMQPLR